MRTSIKFLGFLLLICFAFACETEDIIPEEVSDDVEDIDKLVNGKAGEWIRQFTDNFNSGGNLNQWEKTSRYDYNSNLCKYESWIPRIRNLDGRSSLELRAYKSGSEYKSGHVKSLYNFEPARNEEYRLRSMIKLIAKDGDKFKRFGQTYGAWPAFWTVNEDDWPKHGEIDIMEGYSFENSARFASNLFYGQNFLQNELGGSAERRYSNDEGWHTYEQRWINRNGWVTVKIFVDGNRVAKYNNNVNANLELQKFRDHNIILNLNVGSHIGIFDNTRINLFSHTYMYVDYVRLDKRSI